MQMNGVMILCCKETLNKEIRRRRKKLSRNTSEKVILKKRKVPILTVWAEAALQSNSVKQGIISHF